MIYFIGIVVILILKIIYDVVGYEQKSCNNHLWIRENMENKGDSVSYMYCNHCNLIAGTEDYREHQTKSDT